MLLAGLIGSSKRLEYAITGDTVKCASRIESLEKDRHDRLHGQRWGVFQVKGRLEPLEI
jgi:adenylate cyclase